MQVFRLRVVLEATARVRTLYPFAGPTVYALLAEANGVARGCASVFPSDVVPHPIERLRLSLSRGERYAFGISLLDPTPADADETVASLIAGLRTVGSRQVPRPRTFDGNFRVAEVVDIVTGTPWSDAASLAPLPIESLVDECERLRGARRMTFRFHSPLRWELPASLTGGRRKFFDRDAFPADVFLDRLRKRMERLGLDADASPSAPVQGEARLIENRLVWVDFEYAGGKKKGFRPGGAFGRVTIELPENYPIPWLVWGQYVHVGEMTAFGNGGYRIEELGPDPYAISPAGTWLDAATASSTLDEAAEKSNLPAGELRAAARELREGTYEPARSHRLVLESPGRKPRVLSVPPPRDRALQRAVAAVLAPGLDALFETSSFAYRRNLSRHKAARAVDRAYRDGYRWGVRSDFSEFFDSVDRRELRDRLEAYVGEQEIVELIMLWVESGDPDGQGLPTGAPISPLLANLFLDRFDEAVQSSDARLVRYADDFILFFRDPHEAEKRLEQARTAADDLALRLNGDKTRIMSLWEPFDFLGFKFRRDTTWSAAGPDGPAHLHELGWIDASAKRPAHGPDVALPGETGVAESDLSSFCVVDSRVKRIDAVDERLMLRYLDDTDAPGPVLDSLEGLLIIGRTTLGSGLLEGLARRGVPVIGADDSGSVLWEALPPGRVSASTLAAQVALGSDPERRLRIGSALITAKLQNYAVVARVYPHRKHGSGCAEFLDESAQRAARAASIESLLGIEGAAAARWYGEFAGRISSRHAFVRRVSPDARDPANVMLNLAHTHLYRYASLAARLVGLAPALGTLHVPRDGFDALASDLQEPFRFLMDRAVIEASYRVPPGEFEDTPGGMFPLTMSGKARRKLLGTIRVSFALAVVADGASFAMSYQRRLLRLARQVKRAIIADEPLEVFRLQPPPSKPPST